MNNIKKGDIVRRISYGKDIIFIVKNIIKTSNETIAILRGVIERIEADANIEDLEKISKQELKSILKRIESNYELRIKESKKIQKDRNYNIGILMKDKRAAEKILTGRILHLDGDKKYSEKSYRYYRKLGLNATVKNIPEYKQPRVVYSLLKAYNPDILVITGHDGMIKRGKDYNNLYNYRNSRHFIDTVKEARRYDKEKEKNLVIFARCVSKLF